MIPGVLDFAIASVLSGIGSSFFFFVGVSWSSRIIVLCFSRFYNCCTWSCLLKAFSLPYLVILLCFFFSFSKGLCLWGMDFFLLQFVSIVCLLAFLKVCEYLTFLCFWNCRCSECLFLCQPTGSHSEWPLLNCIFPQILHLYFVSICFYIRSIM